MRDEEWKALALRYVESTLAGMAGSRQRLSALQTGTGGQEILAETQVFVHKIAGTAGTFGFPKVSLIAKTLDGAMRKARQEGICRPEQIAGWDTALEEMERELSRPPASASGAFIESEPSEEPG